MKYEITSSPSKYPLIGAFFVTLDTVFHRIDSSDGFIDVPTEGGVPLSLSLLFRFDIETILKVEFSGQRNIGQ
jgi:hypothetical protein